MADLVDHHVTYRLPDIGKLASLPQTTYALLTLLMSEDSQPKDIERVLETDPALTAKVISLSNSAFYNLETPVSTLDRAILVIGFRELEFMAIGLGLSETFDLSQVPENFDGESLWLHSLAVSYIAKEISVISKAADPSEAMITGLLHDLGLIILVSKFPGPFQQVLELMSAGMSFLEAEATLNLRHDVVGYLLAHNWNLPQVFQAGILYHHRPKEALAFKGMATVVALADILANKIGFPNLPDEIGVDLQYMLSTLGISAAQLQDLVRELMISVPKIQPLWLQMIRSASKGKGGGLSSKFSSLFSHGAEPSRKR
jgi:HD-like signal output (HDOD) protein